MRLNRSSFVSAAALALFAISLLLIGCIHSGPSLEADRSSGSKTYELWEPEPAPNRGHDFGVDALGRGYPYDIDWERWSYPLGNGTLGANVFGRTDVERIQLSEKTFANGSAYNRGSVTNAAEIYLEKDEEHGLFETSYPDDVMVIRLTADQAGALSFTVRPEIPYLEAKHELDTKSGMVTASGDTITLSGTIDYYRVNYEIQVKVLPEGGALSSGGSTIDIKGADAVTLLIAVDTNYELGPHIFLNEPKEKLDPELDPQ